MFESVNGICGHYRPLWAHLLGFKRGVDKLAGIIASIGALVKVQQSARAGITLTKQQITDDLVAQALIISGCICAHAAEVGDKATAASYDLDATDFTRLRDSDMDDKAQVVYDKALALLDQEQQQPPPPSTAEAPRLADYGLTEAALTLLQTRIALYGATLSTPLNATVNISAATAGIERLIEQGDEVLKLILDKLIRQFATAHPDFVTSYDAARIIVESGARSPRKAEPEAAPKPPLT